MEKSRQTILELLRRELEFLESGGYRAKSHWRVPYVFEESPSCPNYLDRTRPHRCEDCWLMEFVPEELRSEQVPCRFVQLTPAGVTVDSLYRCGTPAETEEELCTWLQQRIREIEQENFFAEGTEASLRSDKELKAKASPAATVVQQ